MPIRTFLSVVSILCITFAIGGCLRKQVLPERITSEHCPNFANTFWAPIPVFMSEADPPFWVRFIIHVQTDYKGKSTMYTQAPMHGPDDEYQPPGNPYVRFFRWRQECNTLYLMHEDPDTIVTYILSWTLSN